MPQAGNRRTLENLAMATDFADQDYPKPTQMLPESLRNILQPLAEIRRAVLINDPALLPQIAPAFVQIESELNNWVT